MKDPTGEKKADKDDVVQAITALKARGADVNPYSVAAEANVCRASLVRNPELMSLLARARHNVSDNGRPLDGAQSQASYSPSLIEVQKLQQDNEQLVHELAQSKAIIHKLKQDVERITEEARMISHSVNIAWQQGYLSGQQAAMADHGTSAKSLVENLAEAARAATADGASEAATMPESEPAPNELAEPNGTHDQPAEQHSTNDELMTAYVADAPLHIDDPNVLNDPFTAKLLSALQGEGLGAEVHPVQDLIDESLLPPPARQRPLQSQPASSPGAAVYPVQDLMDESLLLPPVQPRAAQPPPVSPLSDQIDTFQSLDTQARNAGAPEVYGDIDYGTEIEGPDGSKTRFTAEELHDLFRNKYVKSDDPTEPAPKPASKTNETSQSTKKFVGANKPSTVAEPLPIVPRAFPPDIRKACRLLGMNPEDISRATVLDAWKREMAKPGVHPDTGGDTEMAIYLNTAKDALMRWAEDQAPKLGKKFGQKGNEHKPPPKQE